MNQMGPKGARNPIPLLAGAAILVGCVVVKGADDAHVVTSGANAALPRGIAMDYADVAERALPVAFQSGELIAARAGAAFASGAFLTSDASGKLITAAGGAGTNNVVAIAREAATAVDQMVLVELVQAGTKV